MSAQLDSEKLTYLPTFLKLKHFCCLLKNDMVSELLFNSILLFTPNLQDAKNFLCELERYLQIHGLELTNILMSRIKSEMQVISLAWFSESLLLDIWEILVKDQFADLGLHRL